MLSNFSLSRFCRRRLFSFVVVPILGLVLLVPQSATAQFKFREPPNRQDPNALSAFDEQLFWQQFLSSRDLGRFSLDGVLVYRPANRSSDSYSVGLSGNWTARRQSTKLDLQRPDEISLVQNVVVADGEATLVGSADERDQVAPVDLDFSAYVFSGLPLTWEDLLMPFLQWKNVTYVGPDRYLGRPAHQFILVNEDTSDSPVRVRITLDASYAALLKAELFDRNGTMVKRIRVGGFKQFGNQWMFNSLYWENRITRDSVRLDVQAFQLITTGPIEADTSVSNQSQM